MNCDPNLRVCHIKFDGFTLSHKSDSTVGVSGRRSVREGAKNTQDKDLGQNQGQIFTGIRHT